MVVLKYPRRRSRVQATLTLLLWSLLQGIEAQSIQQQVDKSGVRMSLEDIVPLSQEVMNELSKETVNLKPEPTDQESDSMKRGEMAKSKNASIILKKGRSEDLPQKPMNEPSKETANTYIELKELDQRIDSMKIGEIVWFKDTLDVTIQPRVTWLPKGRVSPPVSMREENEHQHEEKYDHDILLTITFTTDNQSLILDLHPNRNLLSESYKETNAGVGKGYDTFPTERQITEQCEYQGIVRGYEETWVALSTCDGLSGVVSLYLDGKEEVEILVEPLPNSTLPNQPHRIFSSKLFRLSERFCGVKTTTPRKDVDDPLINDSIDEINSSITSALPHNRTRRFVGVVGNALWFEKNTRFVELVLIADNSFYKTHGTKTTSRCKSIINIVNSLYRSLGVVVILSYLEIWEYKDKINVTEDYHNNLELLRNYRIKMLDEKPQYNNDNTILLTNVDFEGRTLGYATVSGMCGKGDSVAVVQDKQDHVGKVAYTLTHEMGHNFGMSHDEDGMNNQECLCDTSACIMMGKLSHKFDPSILWSSCSKQVIKNSLDSERFKCLRNVPTRMYPRASCGDGVVDEGEECDCGTKEFCDNPCCNATTCRFAVNASCASGPCCDTKRCDFKPRGVMCRESISECDLPEFCPGNSESCPSDVTKADGTPCHHGLGYCYEAQCGSHLRMCQTMWGDHAAVADEACYTKLNMRGGSNGNCGFKTENKMDLRPCEAKDKLCGSLQCLANRDDEPQVKISMSFGIHSVSNNDCFYVVSVNRIPSWYWLTPDGASCGEGKMCLKQKCVSVPEPSSHCKEGCSGHGVCNSNNHCHCDPGFAPPYCSEVGDGGSLDSHTTRRIRYIKPLWDALFFLCLIGIGVIGIMCFLWSQICHWWETKGRASIPPVCAHCIDYCCCPLVSFITNRLCGDKQRKQDEEAQDPAEQDKMMCPVDINKEMVTKTPKNSSEIRRKIEFNSEYKGHQSTADHPPYMQSISVDSGCISDVEEASIVEPYNSRVSMKSLVSVFKKFGSRASPAEKEVSPPRTFERQRSIPLHRFVVDPLAGSRRSRHGTPPPQHVKQECRRSLSLDEQSNVKTRPRVVPPPPPSQKKTAFKSNAKSSQTISQGVVPRQCDTHSEDTHENNYNAIRSSPRLASANPSSGKRSPMMPPGKKTKTFTSLKESHLKENVVVQNTGYTNNSTTITTPQKAILPKSSLRPPVQQPESTVYKSSNTVSKPSKLQARGIVKDLADKIEKQ